MTTITEFLTARLDEDEAAANAATPGPWKTDDPLMSDFVGSQPGKHYVAGCSVGTGYRPGSIQDAAHIARHNPARVLAEVAAKRAIVELCAKFPAGKQWGQWHQDNGIAPTGREQDNYEYVLRVLAAAYNDHHEYDETWKPPPTVAEQVAAADLDEAALTTYNRATMHPRRKPCEDFSTLPSPVQEHYRALAAEARKAAEQA